MQSAISVGNHHPLQVVYCLLNLFLFLLLLFAQVLLNNYGILVVTQFQVAICCELLVERTQSAGNILAGDVVRCQQNRVENKVYLVASAGVGSPVPRYEVHLAQVVAYVVGNDVHHIKVRAFDDNALAVVAHTQHPHKVVHCRCSAALSVARRTGCYPYVHVGQLHQFVQFLHNGRNLAASVLVVILLEHQGY